MRLTPTISIASASDPRLEPFAALRDKDRQRRGEFVLEGEVVLRVGVRTHRYRLLAVLLLDRLAGLAELVPDEVPVYRVSREVMTALVGFDLHRGVLALAERGAPLDVHAVLSREGPLTLALLVGVSNHDNVGGAFRNARALGADAVLLDETSCDPLYRKAIRVSVGATLEVPFARGGDAVALFSALQAHGIASIALTPDPSAPALASLSPPPRRALVVGAEGPGLAPDALAAATLRARIPIDAGFDSLNVAVALGIALYELRRSR